MNGSSRISIALPVRNAGRFLDERIASIRRQTFQAWEVAAVDGFSQDGSWEKLQHWAARDPRVRCEQQSPAGIYPAINRCIEMAHSDYLYVATADDTMAPDCLALLSAALEARPECDVAHCPLQVINEHGEVVDYGWERMSVFARSSPELVGSSHVRRAPLDGLLHLTGKSVYISLTQLLVRRALFDRIGLFESQWGSVGDFNWNMRATLAASTIHVANTWGGWRMHDQQATAEAGIGTPAHHQRLQAMIDHALRVQAADLPQEITRATIDRWRRHIVARQNLRQCLRTGGRWGGLLRALAATAVACPEVARDFAVWRWFRRGPWGDDDAVVIRRWCRQSGLGGCLQLVDGKAVDCSAAAMQP